MREPSQPVSGFDIPFGADDDAWNMANQYGVWSRRYSPAAPMLRVIERVDGRVKDTPISSQTLRMIPAGMQHRVAHLFGFWRVSDADTLFFRSEQGEDVRYALVVSVGADTYRTEQIAWSCPKCETELAQYSFESKRFGLPAFWQFALERVREFNADDKLRTCKACGAVHPHAYGFQANADRDEEAAARTRS